MIDGILNHLWQSTAFGAGAALVAWALRKHRASVRHRVWLAASLKFLVPFALLTIAGGQVPAPKRMAPAIAARAAAAVEPAGQVFVFPAAPAHGTSRMPAALGVVWACGFLSVIGGWTRAWRQARSSAEIEPGVIGIWRPVLVLPKGLADRLTPAELEAIVAHERQHIRRRDNLFAAIHMAVEAIFWFHPLVWWIGARLLDERERACDEAVLGEAHDAEAYASGILATCRFCLESPVACVSGVSGGDLRRRIERIMRHALGGELRFTGKLLLAGAVAAAIVVPVTVGLLRAQTPVFEVASVKPTPAGTNGGMLRPLAGGGLHATNVPLRLLFQVAYDLQENQITGGPDWMNSAPFDIDAKGGETGVDKVRVKLRSVLADRFQLQFHKETRDLPVFFLTPAKGGLKIQAVTREPKEDDGGFHWGRGRAVSSLAPLSNFARLLSGVVGRTVIDRTGTPGNFDFTLQWTPESKPPTEDSGEPRPRNEPLPDPNGPSLFTALQEQLGLRLEAGKGPVEVYVIDHAEKPAAN